MENLYAQINKMASQREERTAEILSDLVKIRSYSGDEEEICRRIDRLCGEIGFDEVKIDGIGNVIARIGHGQKILAFDAHIDTVAVGDESRWELDPFSGLIRDGKVFGRGAADQKGGAAAMLTAAEILKELGYDGGHTLYFTFTVLEEDCDGLCWKYLIEEENLRPDYVVSTEPTSCRLYRGHRGRMEIMATVRGISAHGSAPERGDSAAYRAARAALSMERLNVELEPDDFLGKGTIVVSKIDINGPSLCAVPDQGYLYLDRRLTWGENAQIALDQVAEYGKDDIDSVRIPEFNRRGWRNLEYSQEQYFPTWRIPEDHPLVKAGVENYGGLRGTGPEVGKWIFSTNCVAIAGRHEIPCIGFGPGDEDKAHAPNEYTRISDLVECSGFYAALPYTLDGGAG
jgi:putative selenium metabolism hydrolase